MKVDLYLDSGAFSAYRRGLTFSVDDYIRWVAKNEPYVKGYMNLDVIPVKHSKTEEAAAASWLNYSKMCAAGLDPIPVYHMGERRYWLEKMIGEGCKHIGLGGVANVRDSIRQGWLDGVFRFLCGRNGYPIAKVHGFGVTSMPLVYRYPWTTTDSVSWFTYSNYGFCALPRTGAGGKPEYSAGPQTIGFSHGSNVKRNVHKSHLAGNHYDVLGPSMKEWVDRYLDKEGFSVEDLHNSCFARDAVTVRYFNRAAARCYPRPPFLRSDSGLFTKGWGGRQGMRSGTNLVPSFDLMFTINLSKPRSRVLTAENAKTRLLSWWWFLNRNTEPLSIKDYAETGIIRSSNRVKLKEQP